jgi:hypothetical protein
MFPNPKFSQTDQEIWKVVHKVIMPFKHRVTATEGTFTKLELAGNFVKKSYIKFDEKAAIADTRSMTDRRTDRRELLNPVIISWDMAQCSLVYVTKL